MLVLYIWKAANVINNESGRGKKEIVMETILFHSEDEYYAYCRVHEIGDIYWRYASQSCDIICGAEDDRWETIKNGKSLHITTKPISYPCIMAVHTQDGDYESQYGTFVYPMSFED